MGYKNTVKQPSCLSAQPRAALWESNKLLLRTQSKSHWFKGYNRLHHNLLDLLTLVSHAGSVSLSGNMVWKSPSKQLTSKKIKMAAVRPQGYVGNVSERLAAQSVFWDRSRLCLCPGFENISIDFKNIPKIHEVPRCNEPVIRQTRKHDEKFWRPGGHSRFQEGLGSSAQPPSELFARWALGTRLLARWRPCLVERCNLQI